MESTTHFINRQFAMPASTNSYVFSNASSMDPLNGGDATAFYEPYYVPNLPTEQVDDNISYQTNEGLNYFFTNRGPAIQDLSTRHSPSTESTISRGPADNSFSLFTPPPTPAPYPLAASTGYSVQDVHCVINPSLDYLNASHDPFNLSDLQSFRDVAAPAPALEDLVYPPVAYNLPFQEDLFQNPPDEAPAPPEIPVPLTEEVKAEEIDTFSDLNAGVASGGRRVRQRTRRSAPSPYPSRRPEDLAESEVSALSLPTYPMAEPSEQMEIRFIIPCLQPNCTTSCVGVEDLTNHLKTMHKISASKSGRAATEQVPCHWATFKSEDGLVSRRQHLRVILQLLNISFRCRGSLDGTPCKKTCSRMDMFRKHWKQKHGDKEDASWDEVYKKC